MMIFLSLLSAFNRRMCCDCVRVVQSNLTALYLFFLFLFLFVMYVYILCKEGREFTKQLLRVTTRIFSERLLPCVYSFQLDKSSFPFCAWFKNSKQQQRF